VEPTPGQEIEVNRVYPMSFRRMRILQGECGLCSRHRRRPQELDKIIEEMREASLDITVEGNLSDFLGVKITKEPDDHT
jgi:hypothetical protein